MRGHAAVTFPGPSEANRPGRHARPSTPWPPAPQPPAYEPGYGPAPVAGSWSPAGRVGSARVQIIPGHGAPPPPAPWSAPTGPGEATAAPAANAPIDLYALPPWREALVDVRDRVLDRLYAANWNHALGWWNRRKGDAISRYALVFFFADWPDQQSAAKVLHPQLRIAVRVVPAGDEADPYLLVTNMASVAARHRAAGRTAEQAIFGWREKRSPLARYLGTALSMVGTNAQTWDDLQATETEVDLAGRTYAWLDDGSCLLLDRLAGEDFGACKLWSSHAKSDRSGHQRLVNALDPTLATTAAHGREVPEILAALRELHRVMREVAR